MWLAVVDGVRATNALRGFRGCVLAELGYKAVVIRPFVWTWRRRVGDQSTVEATMVFAVHNAHK